MMTVKGWSNWTGSAVILPRDNIDTDQIYPGRFLALTDRRDMKDAFFSDWRILPGGEKNLNSPFLPGQSVLIAGENFGCGSSREHAVWAMVDCGYRVVLALSFAPIFRQNAIANGLAPIVIAPELYFELSALQNSKIEVTVDLVERQLLILCTNPMKVKTFKFHLDPFDAHCLLNGLDTLGFLLSQMDRTKEFLIAKKASSHALHVFNLGGTFP